MGDLKTDNQRFAAANAYINHMMKSPRGKKYTGELDEETSELRKYIKLQGTVDIQKFKVDVKTKQMQAKIPKELVQQIQSPRVNSNLNTIDTSVEIIEQPSQLEIDEIVNQQDV